MVDRLAICAASLERCKSDSPITLNGRPAIIAGAFARFALVRDAETGLGAQWAWETVERIVATSGKFRS